MENVIMLRKEGFLMLSTYVDIMQQLSVGRPHMDAMSLSTYADSNLFRHFLDEN